MAAAGSAISQVRRAASRLRGLAGGLGLDARPGSLFLVTGGREWAVTHIARALQPHLQPHYRRVEVLETLSQRPYLTRANIHCLCRPAFFATDGIPAVHPSNRVVVSWLHGGKTSRDPHMAAACAHLERHWRKVRRMIVPNSITYRHVIECGVDPRIVHVIPNGVDASRFAPAAGEAQREAVRHQLGIPRQAFVIGSFQRDQDDVGRPKLVKGPDILVETLAEVHRRHPIFAFLTGPSRTYVQGRLEAMGVPSQYRWAEDPGDLVPLYHVLDAYLISSREEGGPATLRESMACGVPVVSTRMGLAADLIQHGRNGLMAEVGDVQGLAECLHALIERPALRQQVSQAALETIRPLDYRVIAGRYLNEVYRPAFS